MARMTKAECLKFERLAVKELSRVLGDPVERHGLPFWSFPYGDGGTVTVELIRSRSYTFTRDRSSPWLACRYDNPAHIKDGYTRPRGEIDWPSGWFTYPSGKANLHIFKGDNFALELATHMMRISGPESREKFEFGQIEFELEAA